jgi:glutathione S-transferase
MTIKLWGRTDSSNVMKTIWLLAELGLPYDRVDAGGKFGGTATAEYRAMNPLGLVPSLEESDGFSLFESNAIMRYLCNAYAPASPLYPQAARARATVDALLDFQQTALSPPQSIVFSTLVRTPPEKRDGAALAAAITEAAEIWAILDARLGRHACVAGDSFTLADIAFGVHVHRWVNMPIPQRAKAANLHAWYQRLLQRPAYVTHCAGPLS